MEPAVSQAVRDVRHEIAPGRSKIVYPQLHIQIAERTAKVILLPGHFRDAAYVQRHVEFVLSRSAEQGEQHVRRNLVALRKNLQDMGVDRTAIDAEVRRVEAAVRAEIWKQVLLPGGGK